MLGNMADHAAISTGGAGREQLKEKGSRQSFDQEPPGGLAHELGVHEDRHWNEREGLPQFRLRRSDLL
jgi:hypothetical protein